MASTKAPRRLSPQKQQEQRSRAQVVEALEGWICNSLAEDFGEDFLVSIYDDGRSTGLTFQLQLKSTTNARALVPKRTPGEIHYPLDVSDLLHWEDATPPVVIGIWDVVARVGYWQDVPAIIVALDQTARGWRKNGSVSVAVPLKHTLDAAGLASLRHRVGRLVLPAISAGKTLSVRPTFTFPKTEDGQAKFAALKRAIEDGDTVTISRENIEAFAMSPWWERVFGAGIPDEVTIAPSSSDVRLKLVVQAADDVAVEQFSLEMKRVKGGTKRTVFCSDDPSDAMTLTLTVDDESESLQLHATFSHPHRDVATCLILTKVLAIAKRGGALRVLLSNGMLLGALPFDPAALPSPERLTAWERLLHILATIQPRTSRYGQFRLTANVRESDLENANRVRSMCATGRQETRMTFSLNLASPPKIPAPASQSPELAIEIDPFGDIQLFGVTVPMGKVRVNFLDSQLVLRELERAHREASTRLTLKDARVLLDYLEWMPPASGPARTAKSRRLSRSSPGAAKSRSRRTKSA